MIQIFQDTNINTNVKNEEVKSSHNFVICKKVFREGKKRHSPKVEQKTSKLFIINKLYFYSILSAPYRPTFHPQKHRF